MLPPCRSSQGHSTARLCCGLEWNGMVGAWHGHGTASVNQTWPYCVNQMGKTHSKPLAARHARGTAWARHSMWESALNVYRVGVINCTYSSMFRTDTAHISLDLQQNPLKSLTSEQVNYFFTGTAVGLLRCSYLATFGDLRRLQIFMGGVRCGAGGWGTALQVGRSQVWFPMGSFSLT